MAEGKSGPGSKKGGVELVRVAHAGGSGSSIIGEDVLELIKG